MENNIANINEMSNEQIMEAIGQDDGSSKGVNIPRLGINRSPEDDDGNQLPVGEISVNIGAFQVGPVSFNSHILEKSYTHFTNGSSELSKIGMQNHWENMKFLYLGPNSDFAHWTLEDSINNNITTQFGMGGASSLVIS